MPILWIVIDKVLYCSVKLAGIRGIFELFFCILEIWVVVRGLLCLNGCNPT